VPAHLQAAERAVVSLPEHEGVAEHTLAEGAAINPVHPEQDALQVLRFNESEDPNGQTLSVESRAESVWALHTLPVDAVKLAPRLAKVTPSHFESPDPVLATHLAAETK